MPNKLHIGLIGANGRFGKAIQALASSRVTLQLFTKENPLDSSAKVDVLLDVSSAASLEEHLAIALQTKTPIVVGTTGNIHSTNKPKFQVLKRAAALIPVFYSANFSMGMALVHKIAGEWARKCDPESLVEIIETHHMSKKDTPSGTALMLAEAIKPSGKKVHIQSIRTGNMAGKHELHFRGADEHLILIHEAQNRNGFAKGAVLAACFLAHQPPGLYTMDSLDLT